MRVSNNQARMSPKISFNPHSNANGFSTAGIQAVGRCRESKDGRGFGSG